MTSQHIYTDDEMLPLSGIQHYAFCPRQWALIYLEQLWNDNILTIEGSLLHGNVDNPSIRETNGSDTITLRGVRLMSRSLGLSGIADAIEIKPLSEAPKTKRALIKSKLFTAMPIEYKRGKRKINDCDRLQLTAQAMIIEDILGVNISIGAIFYWQERHREYVEITDKLRDDAIRLSKDMHHLARLGITPPANKMPGCRSCSIKDLCVPIICSKNVRQYLEASFNETTA